MPPTETRCVRSESIGFDLGASSSSSRDRSMLSATIASCFQLSLVLVRHELLFRGGIDEASLIDRVDIVCLPLPTSVVVPVAYPPAWR